MREVKSKTLDSGFSVIVYYDEYAKNPRVDSDNLGSVVISDKCRYDFADRDETKEGINELLEDDENICLPVYLYDHSGITIRTYPFGCGWDSGQVGIIYCTKKKAKKWFGIEKLNEEATRRVVDCLKAEVSELDDYLVGDVYGYAVFDDEGNVIDSCWGFIGDSDYCLNEGVSVAKAIAKGYALAAQKEAAEAFYWAARGVLTVEARA